ncbi:uncharacterized protein K02A2.6-like [Achroia grisella]|uniref:uncharacterized protein K02A2.6-like n=1 Tax=Achroia grisella TaxID=688607 RepID=UPI0027D2A38B|nr:uncharacterized protein K02A2.6-like [Achroia grisella]
MSTITTSRLCSELDTIFTSLGLPQIIVSDNGPQFTSQEFHEYCRYNAIRHVKSSPYHPRTNRLAERLVRTFKTRMSASISDGLSLKERLENFLFTYRITPRTDAGKSPAEILLGRQLRCLLDNIKPNPRMSLRFKQFQANIEHDKEIYFNPGETVFVRSRDNKSWKPATKYHADQIRKRVIEREDVPVGQSCNAHTQDVQKMQHNTPVTPQRDREISLETAPLEFRNQFETLGTACNNETPKHSSVLAHNSNDVGRHIRTPAVEGLRRSKREVKPPRRLITELS